jgi:sugar O-acyltransferase (sialic acid O-acetyltransferase NeuD family)
MKKLAIFGTGSAGREVAEWASACGFEDVILTVDDIFFTSIEINGFLCIPFSQITIEEYTWLVAVADSSLRELITKKLNNQVEFATLVHPAAIVEPGVQIGEGALIGPGVLIGNNVKIGKHVFVNSKSYIGHDGVIGDYVTISPCTAVLGNCKIESHAFLGANSSIKEGTSISSGTIVGMGDVVIKNLSRGVYVGNPARKIK